MMEPELLKLTGSLASVALKNGAQSVMDRMKFLKEKNNKEEAIVLLEEIVMQLISDKNELIQIAQAYEEKIIIQKISEEEIDYITTKIVPLIHHLLSQSEKDETKASEMLNTLTPILSKETFNILQLLGFNFKRSIGEPLTELIRELINSNAPLPPEKYLDLQIEQEKRETEYIKMFQNKEAYKNYNKFKNIN